MRVQPHLPPSALQLLSPLTNVHGTRGNLIRYVISHRVYCISVKMGFVAGSVSGFINAKLLAILLWLESRNDRSLQRRL